ncbi:hypothetical protein PTKIN_Ptkin13bG0226000 [Pterospermum kingtungense]
MKLKAVCRKVYDYSRYDLKEMASLLHCLILPASKSDKKDEASEAKPSGDKSRTKETEPSTLEDIAVAARGGMETLRPALQRLYMTTASAYRDALNSFIEGYQEGILRVMEKKEDYKDQKEGNTQRTST